MSIRMSPERFLEMSKRYPYAERKLTRAWVRCWFSDCFRMGVVLLPTYFVVVLPLLYLVGVPASAMSNTAAFIYAMGFVWAMCDNDYETRWRVGQDPYSVNLDFSALSSVVFARCDAPAQLALQVLTDANNGMPAQALLDTKFGPGKVLVRPEYLKATTHEVVVALLDSGKPKAFVPAEVD